MCEVSLPRHILYKVRLKSDQEETMYMYIDARGGRVKGENRWGEGRLFRSPNSKRSLEENSLNDKNNVLYKVMKGN